MPINWRLAAPEVRYILEHSGASLLVATREFAETASSVRAVPKSTTITGPP